MAGHVRTVDTGKTRRTTGRRTRRVREHLPPGEAESARRRKEHAGARALAMDRINRESDPLAQLSHAVSYVRSAAAKYRSDADVSAAVQMLAEIGDRIYSNGTRKKGGK